MVDIRRTGRNKGIVPFPLGARQGWGNECLGRAVARGIAGGIVNRVTNMVDAGGTTTYSYTAGGQLWTEDGPWSNDTVTNTYTYRMRTGLALQQPTGVWSNGF